MIIVNVGANDGFDHCRDFVLQNKDRIEQVHLIEPGGIETCKEAYKDVPQATFHRIAIVPDEQTTTLTIYHPQGRTLSLHASSIREHLIKHNIRNLCQFDVPAMSMEKFFQSQGITKCDRLYIDTEGLDCKILLSFDISKYNFEWIEFEILHTDGVFQRGPNYNNVIKMLTSLDYEIVEAAKFNLAARKIKRA